MTRKTLTTLMAGLVAIGLGSALLTVPASANGSVSITYNPHDAKHARELKTGLALYSLFKGMQSGAGITQDGLNNLAGISQNGSGDLGILEQHGNGNSGSIEQNGDNDTCALFQFGNNTNGKCVQNGDDQTAATVQVGF